MRFTATVKNREVVIRNVMLPDGDEVEVTIEKPESDYEFTEEELRGIEEGEADIAAGRVMSIDELLASLKRSEELRRQQREKGRAGRRSRGGKVGTTGARSKSTASRDRRRK